MARNVHQLPNIVSVPKGYQPLNSEGLALANLAAWHQLGIGHSGILAAYPESSSTQPMGSPSNPIVTTERPWINEPTGAIPFDQQGAILMPLSQPGMDVQVTGIDCPRGFDGVINFIGNATTEAQFVNGSGGLIWKILINNRPAMNFGNILVQKGTVEFARRISPLRIFSGDVVRYTVQWSDVFGAGFLATAEVICSLGGYFYPSRGQS